MAGDSEIRTCIVQATLEHLFENREVAEYSSDWKEHPVLSTAYREAMEWSILAAEVRFGCNPLCQDHSGEQRRMRRNDERANSRLSGPARTPGGQGSARPRLNAKSFGGQILENLLYEASILPPRHSYRAGGSTTHRHG
jgi:hypothetical protein